MNKNPFRNQKDQTFLPRIPQVGVFIPSRSWNFLQHSSSSAPWFYPLRNSRTWAGSLVPPVKLWRHSGNLAPPCGQKGVLHGKVVCVAFPGSGSEWETFILSLRSWDRIQYPVLVGGSGSGRFISRMSVESRGGLHDHSGFSLLNNNNDGWIFQNVHNV